MEFSQLNKNLADVLSQNEEVDGALTFLVAEKEITISAFSS